MKKILLFILLLPLIFASCQENQIDINSASEDELDALTGIGPAKAKDIVNSRPFYSVEDLLEVSGIGEATLEKIKEQNLACVEKFEPKKEKNPTEIEQPTIESQDFPKASETLILAPKNIKTNLVSEDSKQTYATYWLIGFCGVLGILFLVKQRLSKGKNEFRE